MNAAGNDLNRVIQTNLNLINPNLTERQRTILELARHQGEVLVDSLAEMFEVTPQTIRRDLSELCQLRLLQRIHGGALAQYGVENLGYAARKRLAVDEKRKIGQCTAGLVANDTSLFINIGTTTEQVAEYLKHHAGLLVVTNNLNVVNALRHNENINIMTAGGSLRHEDGGIVGEATVDFIKQFKVDYAVIGASAIDEDGAILDYDIREVRVAQAIIANARAIILVADAMKFQRSAPFRIANITEIDYFVTDKPLSHSFLSLCAEHQVNITIAS